MSVLNITLSPAELSELNRRVRPATINQRDGRRARAILLATQGGIRKKIVRLTGFFRPTVTDWCQRFESLQLEALYDQLSGRKSPFLATRFVVYSNRLPTPILASLAGAAEACPVQWVYRRLPSVKYGCQ